MAIRKNVVNMAAAERTEFIRALKLLKAPSQMKPPTRSRYDDYVYIHMQAMDEFTIIDRTKPVENGSSAFTVCGCQRGHTGHLHSCHGTANSCISSS